MVPIPRAHLVNGIRHRICSVFPRSRRTIFSQNGIWDPKLTLEKKREIESFWSTLVSGKIERPQTSKNLGKYYVLSMFPYPSGRLHMGHVRVYAISDAMARYRKMQGYEVVHPMGWDAFGLPAENAAREQKLPPNSWTETNIAHMKRQLLNMGFGFDWDREIRTCDPSYYRWTQDLFLKLWDAGLVYRKEAFVNWDPVDKTVLANEQVDENGCSWRSGAKIERRLLKQWFIRTSHYAVALREGLEDRLNWRDIVDLQQNWIGEICGNWVDFEVLDEHSSPTENGLKILVKDAKELMDVTFIAVAASHELPSKFAKTEQSEQLKVTCRNPVTGAAVPIYVRDAKHFEKDCDIRLGTPRINALDREFAVAQGLPVFSDPLDKNITIEEISKLARDKTGRDLQISPPASYRLKDWLISRQRYWGTPIPAVHCPVCGVVPVPAGQLPVTLPPSNIISDKGMGTLLDQVEWQQTNCPKCAGPAKRETDTMDTFVDSSWYYLRFLDSQNNSEPVAREKACQYMPVDLYIGGKEHALMHLFFARFIGYFLHDQGLLPEPEPFKNLLTQGFVMGKSYRNGTTGRYLKPEEVDLSGKQPVEKGTQTPLIEGWEKMSKSRFNGLDPDDAIREYGVDSTRLFMLGNISPRSHRNWDPELFKGLLNWQANLWTIVSKYFDDKLERDSSGAPVADQDLAKWETVLWDSRNFYLKGVNWSLDKTFSINMGIAKLNGLTSSLNKVPASMIGSSQEYQKTLQQIIIMLFPFAPHFSAELWSAVRSVPSDTMLRDKNVWEMEWPQLDYSYPLDLIVKLCGEEIAVIKVPRKEFDVITKEAALEMAMRSADVKKTVPVNVPLEQADFVWFKEFEAVLDLKEIQSARIRKAKVKEEKAVRKTAKAEKLRTR